MTKQGTGRNIPGPMKHEPNSRAVSPGAVSQIGNAVGRMAEVKPLYSGRGFEAPKAASTIHHCGSQGKH